MYEDAITAASRCELSEDCHLLNGQCSVGLGGCYEAVNTELEQETLNELGRSFSDLGCTEGVCDCGRPPAVVCDGGSCAFGPNCDGRQLGEEWPHQDGCNTCTCTENGALCTQRPCRECERQEDCPEGQWCRPLEDFERGLVCVPFQGEGGFCSGFAPPWRLERCAEGLICTDDHPAILDEPGRCRTSCEGRLECGRGDYCSTNEACREVGACFHPLDCGLPQNRFIHEGCVGYGECGRLGSCSWICGNAQCRDFSNIIPWLGSCEVVLGYGIVNGECRAISGCDNLDLDLFRDMDSCRQGCAQ
jgi:hypothetical protein